MKEVYVVFDRHNGNHRLPFMGIFDTREEAQELVDKLNVNGPVMCQVSAWYDTYQLNTLHSRALLPNT
jgi:hypothetical protein